MYRGGSDKLFWVLGHAGAPHGGSHRGQGRNLGHDGGFRVGGVRV